MPIKRIQRIAAIIFLACLISPIIIVFSSYLISFLQSKIEEFAYTWQAQSHVIIAAIRHHSIAWISSVLGSIIISKIIPIIWKKLPQANNRYLLIGWIITLVYYSGFSLLATGQHTTLYCERIQDTCELNRAGLWWSKTEQLSLHKLRGAYIQVNRSDDSTTERVALVTDRGDIPMTYLSYSPGWQSETARQINAFVVEPSQKFLRVREDNLWISVIAGIIMIIISSTFLVSYISVMWKN